MFKTPTKRVHLVAVLAAVTLALTACGGAQSSGSSAGGGGTSGAEHAGQLAGAGATSQESAMAAWIAEFTAKHPKVSISYDPTGSGGGRTNFLSGAVAFAGSDRALKDEEMTEAQKVCGPKGAFNLPLYISPIAVAFNLDGIKSLNLSPKVLAGIFSGKITKWNDAEIAADNKDAKLPDLTITTVHRLDKSGTTLNFTEYLSANAPDVWTWKAAEEWPLQGGQSDQGTSGVVNTIMNGKGTIGYADASKVGSLGTAAILVGDKFTPFSAEAAAKVVDESKLVEGRPQHDFSINLDRKMTAAGTYPLVLVSYDIVCSHYAQADQGKLAVEFVKFMASEEGQKIAAAAAGNAPISAKLRTDVMAALDAITFG